VLDFAESVESPWRVGIALGTLANGAIDQALLPALLETTGRLAQVVGSFVRGRYASTGWQWVDHLPVEEWTPEQRGQFLAYLPFVEATWQRAARFLPDDEAPYWTKTGANPHEAEGESLELAVSHLLSYGRPRAAIGSLYVMVYRKQRIDSGLAISALLAAVRSEEKGLDAHQMVEVIKALQEDPSTDQNGLFQVEWSYLPLFEHRGRAAPRTLERRLAEDPDFFCELIRLIFKPRNEEPPAEISEERQNLAENAYRLLRSWKVPPGTLRDGQYDGDALNQWLDRVKASTAESGHIEIAMTMLGHVLVSAPPDPGGFWIHEAVAAVLNAKDAQDMRNGFTTQLFNSRGVHGYSAGKDEAELSARYRARADEVESHGYPRFATALRELAASYERYSERERSRDPFGD